MLRTPSLFILFFGLACHEIISPQEPTTLSSVGTPEQKAPAAALTPSILSSTGKSKLTGQWGDYRWKHPGGARYLAFSSDGSRLASSGAGSVWLWDATSGEAIAHYEEGSFEAQAFSFIGNTQKLVITDKEKSVRLWDPDSGKPPETLPIEGGTYLSSSEARLVVLSPWQKESAVWDLKTKTELWSFKKISGGSCSFDSGSKSRCIKIPKAMIPVPRKDQHLYDFTVLPLRVLSGERQVAVLTSEQLGGESELIHTDPHWEYALRLWDIDKEKYLSSITLTTSYYPPVISPDGTRALLLNQGSDHIQLWDFGAGKKLLQLEKDSSAISGVISPDNRLFVLNTGNALSLREAKSGLLLWEKTMPPPENSGADLFFDFSPDSSFLLVVYQHKFSLLSLKDGSSVFTFEDFPGNGKRAVSPGDGYVVQLWESSTGKNLKTMKGHAYFVEEIAVSSNEKLALSFDLGKEPQNRTGGAVKLWNLETAKELTPLEGGCEEPLFVLFSPDDALALASCGHTLSLWDTATSKRVEMIDLSPSGDQATAGIFLDKNHLIVGTARGVLLQLEI